MRKVWLKRLIRGASALSIIALFGCSSSIFTGDKDSELKPLQGDGRFNKLCMGLDLSKPTLDVRTTRALLTCLNSNGSLHEIAMLVNALSDDQLGTLVDLINEQIMTKPARLKALDRTFNELEKRNKLDLSFSKLAQILDKAKLVRGFVRIARQGTSVNPDGSPGKLDPSVIASVKILAKELSEDAEGKYTLAKARETLSTALETGIRATSTKSYKEIVAGLNSSKPLLDSAKGLEFFSNRLFEYLKAKIKSDKPLAKMLTWGIEDGTLLQAFDHYYYEECDNALRGKCKPEDRLSLDEQVQSMAAFMRVLTVDHKDDLLKPMTELFRVMDGPIRCMGDTKEIPNADLFVMEQFTGMKPLDIPQWTVRDDMIKLKVANGLCRFPSEDDKTFGKLMTVLNKLADYSEEVDKFQVKRRPLITVAHFTQGLKIGDALPMGDLARKDLSAYPGFSETERYRRFLINWLGDKDRDVNAYTHLSDALAELSRKERNVMANILYFLNVPAPDSQDRADLRKALRVLMKPRPELATGDKVPGTDPSKWRSLHDVASQAMLRINAADLYDLLSGLSQVIDVNDELARPMLEVQREALLMNDANPLTEIMLEIGLNAERYENLVLTLFDIAGMKEFEPAVQLLSRMAQNKSLKELLQGVLYLFRGTINLAPGEPAPMPDQPNRLADAARDKSITGAPAWTPAPANWTSDPKRMDACHNLNLDLPFGQPYADGSKWEEQMHEIGKCVNANDQNLEVQEFIEYGLSPNQIGKKSALGFLVEKAAGFIPDGLPNASKVWDELGDLMVNDATFTDMKNLNYLFPYYLNKQYCSEYSKSPGFQCKTEKVAVMQALARAFWNLRDEGERLQKMLNLGKEIVLDNRVLKAIPLLYDLDKEAEKNAKPVVAAVRPPVQSYPLNNYPQNNLNRQMLIDALVKYEKMRREDITDAVIREREEEYWNQPLAGAEKFYFESVPGGGLKKRIGYKDAADFKKHIKPLLDELSKGTRVEWALYFFTYMDRNPYTPDWWSSWFRRLANHVRPMPYYYPGTYPGHDKPKVRFVNQLDLLDLVVIDADFTLREVGMALPGRLFVDSPDDNFAIRYLTHLGLAGDNMGKAVDEMERELRMFEDLAELMPDLIMKKEVKRRLFNLGQIFPVLRQLDQVTEYVGPDGKKVYANDLGVLRDLFKATLGATMPKSRCAPGKTCYSYRRNENSMAVIAEMVKFGLLRNIGVNMWSMNPHRNDSFRGAPANEDDDDLLHRDVIPTKASHITRFLTEAAIISEPGKPRRINPDAAAAVGYVLRENCNKAKYKKGCVSDKPSDPNEDFNDRYVLLGKLIDQVFEWIKDDNYNMDHGLPKTFTNIKRAGYQALLALERFDVKADGGKFHLNRKLTTVLGKLLGTEKGAKTLGDHFDLFEELLTEPKAIEMCKLLMRAEFSDRDMGDSEYSYKEKTAYNDTRGVAQLALDRLAENKGVLSDVLAELLAKVTAGDDFDAARSALRWLDKDAEYQHDKKQYKLDEITSDIVHWIPKETTPQHPRYLRPRLQSYVAQELGNDDVRELIIYLGKESPPSGINKDRFYLKTKFAGERQYIDKLNSFMDMLRDGIVDIFQQNLRTNAPR